MENLNSFNSYLAYAYFGLSIISVTYVLARTKFRLDNSALILIIINLSTCLIRIFVNQEDAKDFLASLALNMQWAAIYFFVFEMRKLEDKLKSENPIDL
jgi:hypothetical protein